ncbi:g681 [Coccomyxa viridis]|uniref:G681 protein n=1 Tax=Coccomyxa viridis TaxID=1274662 RepID=A0ABP1FLP2_9CHLO
MSRGLRGFAESASRALISTRNTTGLQQQRLAGDLPVKPNKFVEAWGTKREHIEETYKWDGDVWRTIGIYVFAVPILIYTVIKKEYHNSDRTYGRKEREFM